MQIGSNVISALWERGIVTDYAEEYGEPGYSLREGGRVLIGNWNNAGKYKRIVDALEAQGNELEWCDEWITTSGNYPSKAYRTVANSYSWESSILWTEDGDFLTPDDGIEAWIEDVVNDPHRCFVRHVWSKAQVEAQGFKEYECGFESGWHPGQTADPVKITELIREELGDEDKVDILFRLSEVSQFYIGFCVYVRMKKEEDDE